MKIYDEDTSSSGLLQTDDDDNTCFARNIGIGPN